MTSADPLPFDPVTMEPRAAYLKHFAETLAMGIHQSREGEALKRLGDDYLAMIARAEAAEAESARLRKALQRIAKQRIAAEIGDEEGRDNADYEFAYECIVKEARTALKP